MRCNLYIILDTEKVIFVRTHFNYNKILALFTFMRAFSNTLDKF